jgi:uncharacterized protein
MSPDPSRPVPAIDELTRDFWTGGTQGELRIAACSRCERLIHPPGPICPFCGSRSVTHTAVSGHALVDSFTVVRRPWISGYETPYVVARVRLRDHDDVVLVTNIVDVDPGQVRIGIAVEAVFESREDVYVPVFRPAP